MSVFSHITPAMLGMAEVGEDVRYLDTGGYAHDREHAGAHFKKGDVLTVSNVSIGDWSSTYSFEGHGEKRFNTVMFERVAEAQS